MNRNFYKSIFFFIAVFYCQSTPAQVTTTLGIADQFRTFQANNLQEKIYVHTDRSFYVCGEIVWFRLFYVDGFSHSSLDLSKVAYVEIIDADNNSIKQAKIELKDGRGAGSLFLPTSIASGNYTIRAYTNWMKNYDPDYYFHAPITIVNTFKPLGIAQDVESARYDLQFFPEGGKLVDGYKSKIAFRAIDKEGRGIDFEGAVLNAQKDTIVRFFPEHFGIGSFYFLAEKQQEYMVQIRDIYGNTYTFDFPDVYEKGFVIHLEDDGNTDLKLSVNTNYLVDQGLITLVVHTRNSLKHVEAKHLHEGESIFKIDKQILGDGISHFTVFNNKMQPVCERLYFKKPSKKLDIDVKLDHSRYSTRSKVELHLNTVNENGIPETADLSVSVIKLDSLNDVYQQDIYSYLYLSSDLKGTVESPWWYFENEDSSKAIDNLMLTHGWRRFKWDQVMASAPKRPVYLPEKSGHLVNGKVVDQKTGRPTQGIITYLSTPGKQPQLYAYRSNEEGNVHYELKNYYGTGNIVITANYLKDSIYRFDIANPFSERYKVQEGNKKLDISQSLEGPLRNRSIQMQTQNTYFADFIHNSREMGGLGAPFYLKPDQTYKLDDYTRFVVMEEVMREYVPSVMVRIRKGKFHYMVLDTRRTAFFDIDPLVLLDGVPVFDINNIIGYDPLKIEKLEVVTSKYHYGPLTFYGIVSYTTYKGDLDGYEINPSALIMEYEGLQLQREFYSPRYDPAYQNDRLPDFRNLVYWNPEVATTDGKADLEFYTPDLPGTYISIVQGLGSKGRAGYALSTFTVEEMVK